MSTAAPEKVRQQPKQKGVPTRTPDDPKKAVRQPAAGENVTATMVRKAREEWGIEPSVTTDKWVALRPGQRGHIVHAATKVTAAETLCGTTTNWVGGPAVVDDKGEMNCLWCQTRIASFG